MGRVAAVLAQRVGLAARRGDHRVALQLVVVVEIFIAQRQAVDPLRQQCRQRMLDEALIAAVAEARGEAARQTPAGIDLAQPRSPAVAGERAAGKIHHHFAGPEVRKLERALRTVCRVMRPEYSNVY